MRIYFSAEFIKGLKRELKSELPELPAAIRAEALARGLSFGTNASLIAALKSDRQVGIVNEGSFADFIKRYGKESCRRVFSRAVVRAIIKPILNEHSRLTMHGFDIPHSYGFFGPRYNEEFERSRKEFFDDRTCDQFELALFLLQRCEKRKTLNREMTSYNIKHRAENISREFGIRSDLGNYVANGPLIAAAIYEGFQVRRVAFDSLNAYLNISSKSIELFRHKGTIDSLATPIAA